MTFEQAYQRYHGQLLGWLRGRTAEAEDIAQETWLRAYRHWDRCEFERVRPWLYTIARNVVIDRAKAAKRRPTVPLPDSVAGSLPTPDTVAAAREAWGLLDQLPERDRRIVVATYRDGQPYRETADQLGVSAATVCLRLRKVCDQLNASPEAA